jgi:ATP-dependent DNA helicase RecQ
LTIVISPLISLMKDQVAQLTQSGVAAAVLNSSLLPAEYRRNVRRIKQGKAKLLYPAPEALLKSSMLELLAFLSCVKRTGERFGSAHLIDKISGLVISMSYNEQKSKT